MFFRIILLCELEKINTYFKNFKNKITKTDKIINLVIELQTFKI